MKVLLCTPYNVGPQYVQGGIVVWAQNIVEYYKTLSTEVDMRIIPFDRKSRASHKSENGFLKRVFYGVAEYRVAIKNTRNHLINGHYDVLHLCTSASISLVKDILVMRMAKRTGVKTIVHFHFGRIPELLHNRNWEWWLLHRVVMLSDATVTMDANSYSLLCKQGYKNVFYLPNPLSQSVKRAISSEASSCERDDRKICYVGHVIPTKGVFDLVKACKNINGIRLQVVGKASMEVRNKMNQLAGANDWLVFVGELDHKSVIREMLSSGVFVLPSYTEGFPNVILESMACGCAIVSTSVGAIPEMLNCCSDKPCGLCCEPGDVEGLRNSIQLLLNNPGLARQLADRASKRVSDLYSIPQIWEQMVEIWRTSVERPAVI